jgi:hypothetical protein
MTQDQRDCLQELVDDYTAQGISRDKIIGAVQREAARHNPPAIDPDELQRFIDRIP